MPCCEGANVCCIGVECVVLESSVLFWNHAFVQNLHGRGLNNVIRIASVWKAFE